MGRPTQHGGPELLAHVMRHPLRQHVMFKYAEAINSPSDVASALGAPLNLVSYHTDVLLEAGCIELVRVEPRRGARKHFYRAALIGWITDAEWDELPTSVRRTLARVTMDTSWREAGDALARGGMDDATAHMSRSYFALDGPGRRALADLLMSTLETAIEIERASRERGVGDTSPRQLVMMSFERASRP
jgi:DNA-binding transcriptional ArsR family regulator